MAISDLLDKAQLEANGTASPKLAQDVSIPTMGELLSETDALYARVSESNDLTAKIEAVTGDLEHINATVAQESGQGLSDYSRTLIARAHKALVGVDLIGHHMVALEAVDAEPAEMENFKDSVVTEVQEKTLNDFLKSLKRNFYSGWGDTKGWYSKVVSLREQVIRKNAEALDRATKVKGDPKSTEFFFKENVDVDNNGKISYSELLTGLEHLNAYTRYRLTAKVDKNFEDFIVGCQRLVDGYKNSADIDETELLKYRNLYQPAPEVQTTPITDQAVRSKLTTSETSNLIQTKRFPGAAYVVTSTPGDKSDATPYSFIDETWAHLYVESEAEKKDGVTVSTFYPNQIVNVSDTIAEILGNLAYFDKSWERRDRFMTRVFGSLDKTISVISERLTDSTADKEVDAQLRGLTRVMIRAIQLDNVFNSALINHAIKVSSQCATLNRACLTQYDDA